MRTLLSLPDLPLFNVWEYLLGDLPAHVSFSQTCRRFRELYGKDDAKWQAALFCAGFGLPLKHMAAARGMGAGDGLSWRRLACLLVGHAAVCEIGSCMRANACFSECFPPLLPFFAIISHISNVPRKIAPSYSALADTHTTSHSSRHRDGVRANNPIPNQSVISGDEYFLNAVF